MIATDRRNPSPRQSVTHTTLVAVCVVLVCLLAVTPLLRDTSPCTHDGGLHYYRVVAMRQALGDGILFARYVPDLAFGYGYPFFNYREPLSYYVSLALYLTGIGLPSALNLVYALSVVGAALGAYLLARDLFGPRAGLVAAVGYAYAPYQFLDSLLRGNSPESVALAIIPFILWAFRHLARTGRRRYFAFGTGSLVALFLTHYISSLIMVPVLIAYLAVLWLVYRRQGHWLAVCGALVTALGVVALFVMPALLEQGNVQIHLSRVTRNNDFHYNFLGLGEVFSPPRPVDTSLLNPPMRVHLGLAQAILGAIGLVIGVVRWRDRERRASLLFFAALAVTCILMSTRASVALWEHVLLLPFVQFPWRFVGRATLPIAVLASAAFGEPLSPAGGRTRAPALAGYSLVLLVVILSSFPYTYPPLGYCPSSPDPTITDVFAYEHRTGLVGVDPEGSYFPVWVEQRPVGSPLEAQYEAGGPIARFDETTLPEGGAVLDAKYGPNWAILTVDSPTSFEARYLVFYFPGWKVTVDGVSAAIAPSEPDGLLTFPVPAGCHTVTIRFRETPLRLAADIVSAASLAGLVVILLRYPHRDAGRRDSAADDVRQGPLGSTVCAIAVCVSLVLLGVKLGVIDRTENLFRRAQLGAEGQLPAAQNQLRRRFADGMTLIGFDQSSLSIAAGGALGVDLYWTTYAQPTASYQSVIHIVGPDGLRWSMPDSFRPRGYANYPSTKSWRAGEYALDSHEVELLPGVPPGTYDIVLTLFDRKSLAPASTLDDEGQPAAPTLTLGQVQLVRGRTPADPRSLASNPLDHAFGPVTLAAAHLDRAEMAPGDAALLTTYWSTEERPQTDLEARVDLVASSGALVAEYRLPLATSWYPPTLWIPGDVWLGQHVLRVPANTESGYYELRLSVGEDVGSKALLAEVQIKSPARSFAPPRVEHPMDVPLGDVATLIGFDVPSTTVAPGESIEVTLVWQARGTSDESYHVFVHLLDGDGRLVAQSDGIPSGWTRPTTGWLTGEYIRDVHAITVPGDVAAGPFELRAGLYLPGVGRLESPEGADSILLTGIIAGDR